MITSDRERVHREVVSFVRRSARMRPNQREAWDRLHDRFVVEVPRLQTSTSVDPAATVDLTAAFGRPGPLVVEVGPGDVQGERDDSCCLVGRVGHGGLLVVGRSEVRRRRLRSTRGETIFAQDDHIAIRYFHGTFSPSPPRSSRP